MSENAFEFKNKTELLEKLRQYTTVPDSDNIRFKERIKRELLNCPELLYSLHNEELEEELFTESGELNIDGEWDRYFGETGNIRPYLFIPESQTDVKHFLSYKVEFDEIPRYNPNEKTGRVTFVIFVHGQDTIDKGTGVPRHDLIGAIVTDFFNWSNIFQGQCKIVSDTEGVTDNNYLTRTIVFENILPNSLVQTRKGNTYYVNNKVRVSRG